MSMKKIIAGVAAAALTVSSLAVVGVSAEDDVKTFNFVGKTGTMKVTYSASASYLGGLPVDEVFTQAGGTEIDFSYSLAMGMQDGYKSDNLAKVQAILDGIKVGNGSTVTVTGVNESGRTVTVTATADKHQAWNTIPEGVERIRIRKVDDGKGAALAGYDLDLTVFETIRTITVANTFEYSTQGYYVPANTVHVDIHNTFGVASKLGDGESFAQYWAPYTSDSKDNNGYVISADQAYALEGAAGDKNIEIGANADGSRIYAISIGNNTLRWVNDNIVQNKGAKLKINFMTPSQLKDAITGGTVTSYTTLIGNSSSPVLTPGSSSSTVANDITIGVNLKNTTRLQQTTNIVDYCAEFDWDTLVQNSSSTVSGNVDSIAFRIAKTDNVGKMIADKDWNIGIKSIEIVIPDQATVPGGAEATRILTAGSADCMVKVIGTDHTIFGNGAQELTVVNNITNNNVDYTLKLTAADGSYVQPAGELTLQLSIPSDFKGRTLKGDVKHTCNDGTVENLKIENADTYKTDGYVVVKTSKFSTFGLEFEEDDTTTTEAPETTTEAPETTTEAPATEAPATEAPATDVGNAGASNADDKNANTGVVLAVVPAAIAAAAVVISKKRK